MIKYAKIVDENTGLCEVGLGTNVTYYKSIGLTEMDVEQSEVDYQWYLPEKCPHLTPEESIRRQNELIRQQRRARFAFEADPLRYDYDEALARDDGTAEEKKAAWLAKKDQIRDELPYMEVKDGAV